MHNLRPPIAATVAALAVLAARPAAAQELRYSLTPTAQWVQWDDALGIDDAYLVGGRLGFTFGQYLELQGYYLTRSRVDQELGDLGGGLPTTSPTSLGIQNYGADIVVNLASTRFKPFVRAGGGILRLEPDGADDTRQIALRYGGGLRFGNPGQLRLQVYVEDLMFRLDRGRLTGAPIGGDPQANDLRHNLVYGAGLSIPLGGATSGDDAPRFSMSNFSLPVEVFGGVLSFDDGIGLEGQNLVGARTGVNFGPLVSLRGYYWRGVGDDFTTTQGIQSWGGEGQFRLNAGSGLNPYLIAGAGQLDFTGDYDAGTNPIPPTDRAMLILGGGVALELTERLRLNLAARNHLFNAEGQLEDAARSDDLTSNWLLSAGLGFDIGGTTDDRPPAPRVPVVARVDTVYVDQQTGTVVRQARGEERTELRGQEDDSIVVRRIETMRVVRGDTVRAIEVDTLRGARAAAARGETRDAMVHQDDDTMRRDDARPVRDDSMRTTRVAGGDVEAARGYAGERTITVPVPTHGELYVRYGPADSARGADDVRPSAVRGGIAPASEAMEASEASEAEAMRQAIREILREELDRRDRPTDTTQAPSVESREAFERRLLDRVDSAMAARARLAPARTPRSAPPMERELRDGDLTALERERLLERERVLERDRLLERERVRADIERAVREQVREELDRQRALQPAPGPVVVPIIPGRDGLVVAPDAATGDATVGRVQPATRVQPRSFSVYTGLNVNENAQWVIGGRLNVGPISRDYPNLVFVPEVALGLGQGTTTLLNANAQYRPSPFDVTDFGLVQLYGQLGVGAYVGTFEGDRELDLTLNPAYGVEFTIADLLATTGTSQLFAEHQGVDLFQRNRFVVGLRWPY